MEPHDDAPDRGHSLTAAFAPTFMQAILRSGAMLALCTQLVSQVEWWKADTVPPRNHAGMAYDPVNRRVVLFGGNESHAGGSLADHGDTWEWTGVRWVRRVLGQSPAPRTDPAMAYDLNTWTTILFGGKL